MPQALKELGERATFQEIPLFNCLINADIPFNEPALFQLLFAALYKSWQVFQQDNFGIIWYN